MSVGELIEFLQKLHPDMQVVRPSLDHSYLPLRRNLARVETMQGVKDKRGRWTDIAEYYGPGSLLGSCVPFDGVVLE